MSAYASADTPAKAARLRARGFALCKPDLGSKSPTYSGWSARSLESADFAPGDLLGILGGPLSHGNRPGHATVIIDLDAAEAVAKADDFLPRTAMEDGRDGKPRDHRYYLIPCATIPEWAWSQAEQASATALAQQGHRGPFKKGFNNLGGKRVLDFLGTGGQVVCPSDGNQRAWVGGEPGEPAVVPFLQLWDAVCKLALVCGAKMPTVGGPTQPLGSNPCDGPADTDVVRRAIAYLETCDPAICGQNGHDDTYWPARAMCWGFDLGADAGFQLLWEYFNPRCQPPWSEKELRHKCHDADTLPFGKPRGWLRDAPLPERDGPAAASADKPAPPDDLARLRAFRQAATQGKGQEPYFEDGRCVYRRMQTRDGPLAVPLCNFTARIVEDVVHDDGAEQTRSLAMQGTLTDGIPLPRAEVRAEDFARMDWVVPAWGTRAVVYAGQGTRDHLRAALQLLSGDVPQRTIYGHLGWRKINGAWVYLHAGGAIGVDGLASDIPVSLPEALAGFILPAPPEGAELQDAVRASLGLLRLGPDRLMFSLLAATYRAPLGDTDFAQHLSGPTGTYKSEAAALAQQHFGRGMDARHLPAAWSSTGNALEALAFAAKDVLLVVDDFCPTGAGADVQRSHREADRLFRGQGNRAGRQRLRADASLRPSKPPRGLILSTGEDTPRGQSLRARLLVSEISQGDLGPQPPAPNPMLSACQRDAAAGKYAAAMAGFVRWLAPQYDAIRARLRGEVAELRDRASCAGQHARTPGIVADLGIGLRYFLDFALSAGAISDQEKEKLWVRGWAALVEAGAAQGAQIASGEPAGQFLRLLGAALASGSAHIADRDGNTPCQPQRWGWRLEESHHLNGNGPRYRPQGRCVGWLDAGALYLEPDASFAVVQGFAREQNESLPVTETTLRRRLKEKGFLASTDTTRGKLTVRRTLQGARREVLHVAWPGPDEDGADDGHGDAWEPT